MTITEVRDKEASGTLSCHAESFLQETNGTDASAGIPKTAPVW